MYPYTYTLSNAAPRDTNATPNMWQLDGDAGAGLPPAGCCVFGCVQRWSGRQEV